MMQRIFHPIGQGAFYSERHQGFNIVYDCGTEWKNRSNAFYDKVVRQSFKESDVIDILFISHFDYDHVSKIEVLRDHVKEIRFVVLPLLHNNEKILISNIYRNLDLDISPIIDDPDGFFKDSRVIYVKLGNDKSSETNNSPAIIEEITADSDGKYKIESKRQLSLSGLPNWVYIPYNYEYTARNIDLLALLTSEGFDTTKLQNDSNYSLDKIINDLRISRKLGGKKFKQIYDKLDGKINQNSMTVYSGPFLDPTFPNIESFYNEYRHFKRIHFYFSIHLGNRVACVFTGDADLNISTIQTIYAGLWQYVGTIQIPHHGDLKSFSSSVISDKRSYICPISFGNRNTYGHPSSLVISKIISKRSYPVFVTEVPSTMLIQHIEHRL
jgi:hypothetical protein